MKKKKGSGGGGRSTRRATRSHPQDDDCDERRNGIQLMKQSGQTDQERRTLRRSQRLLHQKLMESGCDLEQLADATQENNTLFEKVSNPREAVLDANNLQVIASRLLQTTIRGTEVKQYDADRLVSKLKSKFQQNGGSCFDWAAYSNQYGVWASAIPTQVSFLNGPLVGGKALEVRKRPLKRARIEEEECEEETPDEVLQGHTERNADQLSAVEKSIWVLNKTLRKRVKTTYQGHKRKLEEIHGVGAIPPKLQKKLKQQGLEIDAIQYLFNPNSFTQTVENLFHYSFLVKKGMATLQVTEEGFEKASGGAVCKYIEDEEAPPGSNTQAVLSLTMQDWRDLCRVYKVSKGDVPHRTGSKQTKSVDLSLSSHIDGVEE